MEMSALNAAGFSELVEKLCECFLKEPGKGQKGAGEDSRIRISSTTQDMSENG
jgi:hypothetical protein